MIDGFFWPQIEGVIPYSALWCPMVLLSLGDVSNPNTPNIVEKNIAALIDTGSEICLIDEGLIQRHPSFTFMHDRVVSGAGGAVKVKTYLADIIVDGHVLSPHECGAFPLKDSGCLHEAVFGMSALRLFVLSVNRSTDRVTLSWAEQ
jgi:predicted aspartyl protease